MDNSKIGVVDLNNYWYLIIKKPVLAFLLSFISLNALAIERALFAVDVIRHGDRTPVAPLPTARYTWTEDPGQLTAKGMQQEFLLGAALRKKYINEYHLLPVSYSAKTMQVRSSDFDRTLMSATSLLMGLYPLGTGPCLSGTKQAALPQNFQPIPIHAVPQAEDNLIISHPDQKQLDVLLKKYVSQKKDWQMKETQLRPKLAHWSEATGFSITNIMQLDLFSDALIVGELHHVPAPAKLSAEDIKQIIAAGRWVFIAKNKPQEIGSFFGHSLLSVIVKHFKEAIQAKTPLKYMLFSAHDTTILALMSAMRVPLELLPPYASDLNFMLFIEDEKNYKVKITYNNKPVFLPGCKGAECSLSQFIKIIDAIKS